MRPRGALGWAAALLALPALAHGLYEGPDAPVHVTTLEEVRPPPPPPPPRPPSTLVRLQVPGRWGRFFSPGEVWKGQDRGGIDGGIDRAARRELQLLTDPPPLSPVSTPVPRSRSRQCR